MKRAMPGVFVCLALLTSCGQDSEEVAEPGGDGFFAGVTTTTGAPEPAPTVAVTVRVSAEVVGSGHCTQTPVRRSSQLVVEDEHRNRVGTGDFGSTPGHSGCDYTAEVTVPGDVARYTLIGDGSELATIERSDIEAGRVHLRVNQRGDVRVQSVS